jgi:hypothetical protein
MPTLVAGIHDFFTKPKTWMAGTSPAMTDNYATNPNSFSSVPEMPGTGEDHGDAMGVGGRDHFIVAH